MKTITTQSKLCLLCLLLIPIFCFADNFKDIREQTTYWHPYRVDEITIVLNKGVASLNTEERELLHKALMKCRYDTDKVPKKFFYFFETNLELEGLVSKNWPELERIRYVADLNEIMLDVRKKIIK